MSYSKIKTMFLASSVTILAISLIFFPQECVKASVNGLEMWWKIVFPSLLPFFILSELLIGFGVVRFIGVLLEPLMRPLFRVPGVGGFVWAMGMASGYPAGAKLTVRLCQEGHLTKGEAERLVTFTNCSNPLFIFGAVSVGFFLNEKLGIILAISHYLGNFTVGIIMRFYGKDEMARSASYRKFSLKAAFEELHQTRINDNRPIGKLLGDAVTSSIQTLMMIGGFIILFSVINNLLFLLHITPLISIGVEKLLHILHLPVDFSIPILSGLFEITSGSKLTSEVQRGTIMQQAIVTSFILAFSGFSVQAQVASILSQANIHFKPFFISRILHGTIAAFYTFIFWEPVYEHLAEKTNLSHIPVFLISEGSIYQLFANMMKIGPLITICSLMVYILLLMRNVFSERHL